MFATNITLNQILFAGHAENIYLSNIPKGRIKKIEIYSLNVCPNMLIESKRVEMDFWKKI